MLTVLALRYLLGLQPCAEHVTASNFGYVFISKLGSNLDPPDPIFSVSFSFQNSLKLISLKIFSKIFLKTSSVSEVQFFMIFEIVQISIFL